MHCRDCVRMKQLVPRRQKKVQQSCKDIMDHIDCAVAWNFCWDAFASLFQSEYLWMTRRIRSTLINYRDQSIRRIAPLVSSYPFFVDSALIWAANRDISTGNPDIDSCYPAAKYAHPLDLHCSALVHPSSNRDIAAFLNDPSTQAALGVDPRHGNWSTINFDLNQRFASGGDYWSFRAEHYLAALLERGVRVLVYVGANDWICNWVRFLFLPQLFFLTMWTGCCNLWMARWRRSETNA